MTSKQKKKPEKREPVKHIPYSLTAAEVGSKFSDKRELYNFVVNDVKAWVPGFDQCTTYLMADIISGKVKRKSPIFVC